MIFRNFAERLLGSKAKVKLLSHILAPYADGQYFALPPSSEREFAKLVGLSHTAVQKSFQDFYDANLVHPANVGNSKMWVINPESYAFQALVKQPLPADLFRRPPALLLQSLIRIAFSEEFNSKEVAQVVIYGSVANKTETPSSDIDLLIMVSTELVKQKLQVKFETLDKKCRLLFGNQLSVNCVVLSSAQPAWIADALENGIKVM